MIRYNTKRYWGYSGDTRPKNAQIGDRFLSIDTSLEYVFTDYNEWRLIGASGSTGGGSGTTLYWYAENATPPAVAPTAIGSGSIALGDGAEANDAVMFVYGPNSGQGATATTNSNFIGDSAGYNADDSSNSNFIGTNAGYNASGSYSSNFIGNGAGRQADISNYSNFIGLYAGSGASNSFASNFIGQEAGFGAKNTDSANFIGLGAGLFSTGITDSIFIGQSTGAYVTGVTGSNFIGNQAGYSADDTPTSNFIGFNAGYGATGSSNSNFIGNSAGTNAINNTQSNIIGWQAGQGSSNSYTVNFIGNQAGISAYNSFGSNFIGNGAGFQANNSSNSNFFGNEVGYRASTSFNSNFIGYRAGYQASGSVNSNFIGYGAGSGTTASSYSILIGYNTGKYFANNGISDNNIIIGKNISLPNNTTNAINIGGILFGTGTNSSISSTPSITAQTNGRIGIGTVSPAYTLDVNGSARITNSLSANTLYVTGLTQTSGITSTGGIIFPQKTISSTYTATTSDYMIDVTGGTFNIQLPTAVGVQGKLYSIKNNGGGAVTIYPYVSETIDEKPFLILGETNAVQLISDGVKWVIIGQDRSTVNNSSGVFEFSGLSKVSSTQFSVAPVKGWIVDATSNPLNPQILYVTFSGGTYTDNYVFTDNETFVYLTSAATIQQQATLLTEQQRRQNIFLGKIGHPDKTTINLVFNQPDFVISPLSQLRDMFVPINLINGGIYPSANGTNLAFNTSAGYLYGLGINFSNNTLNPNAIYLSGTSPCTFQYRTQTGGTITNVTAIDPDNYDNGGVITPIGGGSNSATNQRIFLLQNGTFRVQYGQTVYTNLADAIAASQTESFTTFANFINNATLIGILSVQKGISDLSNTSNARFLLVSKFGESVGAAGGISTTNLQQAYNNSGNPEILTNSTLGALHIKNGAGLDTTATLFDGINSSGDTIFYVGANGTVSGITFITRGFTANTNGLTATTISATTYQNLPRDVFVTGGSYNSGAATITFTNNTGGTFTVTGISSSGGSGTFSGGTVSNATIFTGGLSASTFSATTYQNLPNTLYTGNGALSGNRLVNLSGSTLSFSSTTTPNNLVLSGGNIGIGTSTPIYTLDVSGSTRISGDTLINGITVGKGYNQGVSNTVVGFSAASNVNLFTGGLNNTIMGYRSYAGAGAIGSQNVVIGADTFISATTSTGNVIVGYRAGYQAAGVSNSVFIGQQAGFSSLNNGSNVFIGNNAGYDETNSNRLYISNSRFNNLIYGEFDNQRVGINTTSPSNALTVSAVTDPVKFQNLQTASTDTLLTVDATGVVHKSAVGSVSGVTTKSFGIVIDGSGQQITTGIKADLVSPYNMTINSWTIVADVVGSITIDIWKDTYANFPPTVADTIITSGTKPNITGAIANQSSNLTGWNTTVTTGDIIRFNVDSVSTIKRITLSLTATLS